MSMSLTEEEIKAWWDEVERELAKQVLPEMPKYQPPPIVEKFPTQVVFEKGGIDFYTLHDDYQFPVDADYPNAQGWKNV